MEEQNDITNGSLGTYTPGPSNITIPVNDNGDLLITKDYADQLLSINAGGHIYTQKAYKINFRKIKNLTQLLDVLEAADFTFYYTEEVPENIKMLEKSGLLTEVE